MAIDWDALVLAPVMGIFGEGVPVDKSTWPLYTLTTNESFRLADAVFDREYSAVTVSDDGVANSTRRPVLGVRLALFAVPPAQGNRVYIPSVGLTFIVREVQEDGHGEAQLMLMVAAS
jgi:hypothetical protein